MDSILSRALESGSPHDLQSVSDWWSSGLHTREVDPVVARTLVDRGATLTVHAAAGLGFTDDLARMLDRLEAKGLVTSERVASPGDAGSRRVFAVTTAGARSLAMTRATRDRLWAGVKLQALLNT